MGPVARADLTEKIGKRGSQAYDPLQHPQEQYFYASEAVTAPIADVEICPAGQDWRRQLINVVGSTFVGKTHWLRHLFREIHSQFHYGVVFSSTDKITSEYNWMPTQNRYDRWNDTIDTRTGGVSQGFRGVITCILRRQADNIKKMGQESAPYVFMIIDDPLGAIDFHHSEEFKMVAGQLRKYNTSLFVITQYIKYLSPMLRNGCHKIIIFQNTEEDLMKVKELLIGFRKKQMWLDFIIDATQDFGGVIYDRVTRSFYRFRAPATVPSYKMTFG